MNARTLSCLLATAIFLSGLTGCRPIRPPRQDTAGTPQVEPVPAGEELTVESSTNWPNPGAFQTVETKNADGTITESLQARGEVGRFGGSLTLSTFGGGPRTFNAWSAGDVESSGIGLLQYERLVDLDPWTGEFYPRLAKTMDVSKDGHTYTFVLRKGLKWSDGKPLTADDVVFTFDKLIREGYGTSSVSMRDTLLVNGKFPKVEKLDDLTIRFTLPGTFAPFLAGVRGVHIAPKHALEEITKKPQKNFDQFWSVNVNPKDLVTSGVFKLKRYVVGQRVELERNPNYFMVDKDGQHLPYLDRFVVVVVPTQNTQIIKFYGNELDMLDIRSVRGSDVALMKPRQKAENFRMYNLGPDDGTTFMMLNMCRRKNDKGKSYVDPIKQEWFNSQKFRQAISHAIDRQRIIDNVNKGIGLPLFTSESPAALYVNKELKPFDADRTLAANLLKEDGFVLKEEEKSDRFPHGRLYDKTGHPIEFSLITNAGNAMREGTCLRIKDVLAELGMKINFQAIDFNVLVDKTETSLDWEAIVMGLSGDKIEPFSGANVLKSTGRLHMFDQRLPNAKGEVLATDARDWEKRIDQLFDQGAAVLGFEQRKPYYWESQQIMYDQQPFIYLYSVYAITAVRNTIGNYRPKPWGVNYTPMGSMHNIEEIYFKQQPN